jgi:hypothetical protein
MTLDQQAKRRLESLPPRLGSDDGWELLSVTRKPVTASRPLIRRTSFARIQPSCSTSEIFFLKPPVEHLPVLRPCSP